MGRLFGTDGIRGEANRAPMDGPTGLALGRALGGILRKSEKPFKVVLGKDTRISGDMLASAVAAGIASAGGTVLHAGVIPTPGVAFLVRSLGAQAGVMISASHNPFQDNGFKVFTSRGMKLSDAEEAELEAGILSDAEPADGVQPFEIGRVEDLENAAQTYMDFLAGAFPEGLTLGGLRLVLDTANGAASAVAPGVFKTLGAEVEVLHNQPDGVNINRDCGSEHTGALEEQVRKSGARAGLAFDGDADRLIAVDETGRRLTGDQVLMILASDLHERGLLADSLLVTTVMSNLGLVEACRAMGISHHAAGVGDRFVLEDMRRLGAVLGGEDSGHMILLDHHTTGDGILSGLMLLACAVRKGKPLSELAAVMKVFPQELINVEVSGKPDIQTIPEVRRAVREVESELGEKGRVLVRYSGTQNICRVMVEGPTLEVTRNACERIAEAVGKALG